MPGRAGLTAPRRRRSGPVCWCAEVRRWAWRSRRRRSAPARCGPRGRAHRPDKVARDRGAPGRAGARRAIVHRRSGGGVAVADRRHPGRPAKPRPRVPTAWTGITAGDGSGARTGAPSSCRRRCVGESRGRLMLVSVRAFGHWSVTSGFAWATDSRSPPGRVMVSRPWATVATHPVGKGSPDQALQRRQQLEVDEPWRPPAVAVRPGASSPRPDARRKRDRAAAPPPPRSRTVSAPGTAERCNDESVVSRCGSSPAGVTTIDQPEWSARGSIRIGRSRRKRNTRAAPAPVVATGSSQAVTSGRFSDRQPATERRPSGNTTQSCRPRSNTAAGTARPQRKRSSSSPGSSFEPRP